LKRIRIGCSGWNYKHWRDGAFYPPRCPQRLWLEYYAERFDTVELNNTFYRLPRPAAVANWVERTPPGFCFAVKASRYLTHVKRLTDLGPGIKRFYAAIEPLSRSPKLGPVLWQLPPRFRRDDERLGQALEQLPPGRHCFEFRDETWFADEVYALLREFGVALVIGDHPERQYQAHELTSDWTFVRFHAGSRGRQGNYSETELQEWAERLRAWGRWLDVYAYFNNDWRGFAPKNAASLRAKVG
jgi:uncharacterized protein YecE (DUF72 family)